MVGAIVASPKTRGGIWCRRVVAALMSLCYLALAFAPPTNTEAAFGDAAVALAGEAVDARIAYFADVQDNALTHAYVISGLRRLGLATLGLPVATAPSLIGVVLAFIAIKLLLSRLGGGHRSWLAIVVASCSPLVAFLGTRAWPDSLASGLVVLGLSLSVCCGKPHTGRRAPLWASAVMMIAGCVLKPNLVTLICALLVVAVVMHRAVPTGSWALASAALLGAVTAIGAWSVLVEQPVLSSVGVNTDEASLISRILDLVRIEVGDVCVTFARYHAYLALLLLPTVVTAWPLLARRPSCRSSVIRLAVGAVMGATYWIFTKGRPTGELDFGRIISSEVTEVLEALGVGVGVATLPLFVRQTIQRRVGWIWILVEIPIALQSVVRPTQRYLLPSLLLGIVGVMAAVPGGEGDAVSVRRRRWQPSVFAAAGVTASTAWALIGLAFVVSQGRASEQIWRHADQLGIVKSTGFGPVEVHVGYRATLGDGSCFEVVQVEAGVDPGPAVAVAPMRVVGRLVRQYVLRPVAKHSQACPDVPLVRGR